MWVRAAAAAFQTAVALRNRAYDQGWRTVHRADVPVISVGNLAVGGQGKTPFTIWLCQHLNGQGVQVGVLSRGYGRRSSGPVVVSTGDGPRVSAQVGGDEPVLIAGRTSALVVVDADRVRAARRAVQLGARILILDDGHQHRRLHRDLNLVLAGEPLAGQILPAGRLREPTDDGLARADGIVWVDCPQAELAAPHQPFQVRVQVVPEPIRALGPGRSEPPDWRGRRVGVAAAIARPHRVVHTVQQLGAQVVASHFASDHRTLTESGLRRFGQRLLDQGATDWITTEKDEVKLAPDGARHVGAPGWVLPIRHRIVQGEAELVGRVRAMTWPAPR